MFAAISVATAHTSKATIEPTGMTAFGTTTHHTATAIPTPVAKDTDYHQAADHWEAPLTSTVTLGATELMFRAITAADETSN
jgi:hypothetical protein